MEDVVSLTITKRFFSKTLSTCTLSVDLGKTLQEENIDFFRVTRPARSGVSLKFVTTVETSHSVRE